MDNPQLAKASPQLSLHPALIPPYCNPAFVPPEEKKRGGGCLMRSREELQQAARGGGDSNGTGEGAEIEEYEWEQIG